MKLPENLPALLRQAGLSVVVIDGWEDRERPPSTGSFGPVGSLNHHTGASAATWSKVKELAYAKWMFLVGRSDLGPPLCQTALGRSGTVYLGAAGRANHAGVAKASGSVGAGDGNSLYVGTEWMLSGTEPIPSVMMAAGITLNAVLTEKVTAGGKGTTVQTVSCHYNTSVTGKWDIGDPNGVPFNGQKVLDIPKFRAAVDARRNALYGKVDPVPVPPTRPKIPAKGVVLPKGPSDHHPFVKDFWLSRDKDSQFRVGFWNAAKVSATKANGTIAEMQSMGCDLIVLNEAKRKSGIIALLRKRGYHTAYNDPEFLIAWLPGTFEFVNDRDMVMSDHDYWRDKNEALSVVLRRKIVNEKVRVIDEHPPAHVSRPSHPSFDKVLEVHKDVAAKNEKIAKRTTERRIAALIARDSNIDPRKDRPVYQGSWKWAYKGWKYHRAPEPTRQNRHIDEMLSVGLRSRRFLG